MEKDDMLGLDESAKYNQYELYDIDLPILFVLGLSEKINSIRQLVEIRNSFAEKGYRTALVSDSIEISDSEDCYSLPMFSEKGNLGLDQVTKIIQTNHYIKELELKGDYELLIVGVLKGTGGYGRKIIEDFGICAYCLSKAVKPDCVMLNVFYGDYDQNTLETIGKGTANMIESDIDFYNIVNEVLDITESEYQHKVYTQIIDFRLAEKKAGEMEKGKVFYLCDRGQIQVFTDAVTEKLGDYAEIIKM